MYSLSVSSQYRRQVRKIAKNNIKIRKKIEYVVGILMSGKALPRNYHDHKLKGDFVGCRECHVFPYLLLVYEKREKTLFFIFWI
jgi:mRNA interferase YafQ